MSTKPTSYVAWNTGGANNTEPSAGKKVTGWSTTELPPVHDFHWILKLLGEYSKYIYDAAFTGPVSFAGDVTLSGALKHGDRIRAISPLVFSADANWAVGSLVSFGDAGYIASSGAGKVVVTIPLVVGERIKSVTYARFGTATSDFTAIQVYKMAANGTVTDITAAATTDNDIGAAWGDKVVDVTDTTAADGDSFWIRWTGNATGMLLGSIRVTYDRP